MSAESSASQETPSLVGTTLDGRYRLTRKLGEGGMGEVYAADHVHIEKKYAVKLLRPEIVSNQEAVARFKQEARSSSSIGHRNIIAIEDFGQLPDGRVFMCMELLNGAPLNDMITQPMPVDRLLNILIQTGHGLAAAHAKNIVHRDMKPENIYVTVGPNGEDVPKLLDFGIAKVAGNDGQNHLTRTGTIFGTPFYMAPEQALGNQVDARTDIYAVGVIMYEVFAGSLPFQGDSFMGILTQHITTDPEPVAQRAAKAGRQLPGNLADIITRCMRKNPAERFGSMDELVAELVRIYRGIAGAGMSSYMEAFPVAATSGHVIQPTPPPMNAVHAGGSQPFMPPQRGGTGPNPILPPSASGGLYDPNQHVVDVPAKKSNTGLIVAIIILLAAGGGVAAFLIMNNKSDGKGKGSGSAPGSDQVALVDDKPKTNPGSGSATEVKPPPPHEDKTVTTNVGSAGSAGSAEVKTPPPPQVDPVAPAKTKVFLQGLNVGRYDVFDDTGKKLDEPMVYVEKDKTVAVTVKASGYKDKQLVVDDKKDIFQFRLDAKPGVTPPPNPPHNNGSNQQQVTHNPPPPDNTHHGLDSITNGAKHEEDCTKHKLRPNDKLCVKQYCKAHSGTDGCPED